MGERARVGWGLITAGLLAGCPPKTPPPVPVPEPPTLEEAAAAPVPEEIVYTWRVSDATPEPAPLGELVSQFYDLRLLLSASPDEGRLLVASALDDGTQDRCAPTSALALAPGGDGAFALESADVAFRRQDIGSVLRSARIEGRLSGETLALDGVHGLIDTRDFVPMLGADADDALCTMMPAMGPCVACPDGAERCWSIGLTSIPLVAAQTDVTELDRDQVCADPACASAPACR